MIIQVEFNDLPDCLSVIHESFGTVAADFGLTKENCPTNGAFMPLDRLERNYLNGEKMFGLMENGSLVGFLQLSLKGGGRIELEKLAVLPKHRHMGYGARLLDFAATEAVKMGGKRLTIGIIEENQILKSWYITHGFISTGTKIFDHLPFTVGFMERSV